MTSGGWPPQCRLVAHRDKRGETTRRKAGGAPAGSSPARPAPCGPPRRQPIRPSPVSATSARTSARGGRTVPIAAACPECPQGCHEGRAAQPNVGLPRPPVQHSVGAGPALGVEPLHQRTDDVHGKRINQVPQARLPHKSFDPRQVGVRQQFHPGLQKNDGGQAALVHRHRPQLGTERGDVVAGQPGVAPEGVADSTADCAHRCAIKLQAAAEPEPHLVSPVPGRFALQRVIDEFSSSTHLPILSARVAARRLIPAHFDGECRRRVWGHAESYRQACSDGGSFGARS